MTLTFSVDIEKSLEQLNGLKQVIEKVAKSEALSDPVKLDYIHTFE
jgi:hypothetical protein